MRSPSRPRKSKGQEYSAVKGFFRHYEIIYVAADERDVIRLRTNYRGEDDYLYRLKVTPAQARALLMDYVASMNALVKAPQFYNALVDNCTTSIRQHVTHVTANPPRVDWRLLANGYGDQMLYERGSDRYAVPFEELRAKSRHQRQAKALDRDPDFSQGIREGCPTRGAQRTSRALVYGAPSSRYTLNAPLFPNPTPRYPGPATVFAPRNSDPEYCVPGDGNPSARFRMLPTSADAPANTPDPRISGSGSMRL